MFLDPTARATYDKKADTWLFKPSKQQHSQQQHPQQQQQHSQQQQSQSQQQQSQSQQQQSQSQQQQHKQSTTHSSTRLEVTLREAAEGMRQNGDKGLGVDCEEVTNINIDDESFVHRNFTDAEIAYCRNAGSHAEVSCDNNDNNNIITTIITT